MYMKPKTKKIIFRVDEVLYSFIHDIANENNITTSEMLRKILEYFFVGYLIGEFKRPLKELKNKFMKDYEFLDK